VSPGPLVISEREETDPEEEIDEAINQAPSIRTNLTSKEVLRELTNERPTNGFLNIISCAPLRPGPRSFTLATPFSMVLPII